MRPRLALLIGALVVPALPLVSAAPAHAVDNVYCVGSPGGTCTQSFTTIQDAITAAGSDGGANTLIRVGPGTYEGSSPYVLTGSVGETLVLQGSGAGTGGSATVLTLPANAAGQSYVTANHATVQDLRIVMNGAQSAGDRGIFAQDGSIVDNVVIIGSATGQAIANAAGLEAWNSVVRDMTVNLTQGSSNRAVVGDGGNVISDSTWNADIGYELVGSTSDTVSRVTIRPSGSGIGAWVQAGTLNINDSVIDLGGGTGVGLLLDNPNPSNVAKSVTAHHLTVVGGGAGSKGVWAKATRADTQQTSPVTLSYSVVRGPATSVQASATNEGGLGNSSATVNVSYSSLQTVQDDIGAHGAGGVSENLGNLPHNVDPGFVNPSSDFALRATSPLVDKAVGSTSTKDRAGRGRPFDGDRNGVPVPDIGAYELRDATAPNTTFTEGPQGPTNDNTPLFQFKSEDGAKFECRVDTSAWQTCASPVTTTPLPDGPHSFSVRATDEVFNVEPTPATRSFRVDTAVPNATITKKPPKRFFKKRVKFKFATNEPGATFQCMLDNRAWKKCQPTYRFNVKVGKHRLLVRAVDSAGNVDPTPARYKYKRLARRR